jgi:cytosine/adenosine deaminase-related metal-dependent hydrolase
MGSRRILAAAAILGADYRSSGPVAIEVTDGIVTAVEPLAEVPAGRRLLAAPALADAHNHGRPISTTSFAAQSKPLESWLIRLAAIPAIDPEAAATAFFAHAALGGVGSIMMHHTRASGRMSLAEEVGVIARAAATVGVNVAYAAAVRDRNPLVYAPSETVTDGLDASARQVVERLFSLPPVKPSEWVKRIEDIAAAVERPGFSVQFGPNGVHWCSDALLGAIAEASATTGRRVHMHLLETRYQRAWADQAHPGGVVKHLKSLGLLSPRLTLAHCVWARPDELELIAEAGATISVNTSSNLALKSGIAPVAAMLDVGVKVAVGLDNAAFDEDDDALREVRLFKHLHQGWGFDDVVTAPRALGFACGNGRASLGLAGAGAIALGEPADLLILDLDRLDRDGLLPIDPLELLMARGRRELIAELIVAGRTVVADGALPGLDLSALDAGIRAECRAGLPERADFLEAWPAIEPALARFYRDRLGCC